jgi:type IV secretory pathway VirB2 component (pilin)
MTLFLAFQQASLADPPASSAIAAAAQWIGDLLFGPLATSIAVIAVAWVGFAMLSGRIEIRRGLSVVFGCFLLLGAKGIALGLYSASGSVGTISAAASPPPSFQRPQSRAPNGNAFDPYAGASVRPTGQ